MTRRDFVEIIQDRLMTDLTLSEQMLLAEIPEWDSLGHLTMVALYDELFSIEKQANDLVEVASVKGLVDIVNDRLDDA